MTQGELWEVRHIPGKGKRVMIWLRYGCTFLKKPGVGYDLIK
jgi:hypothetical protein